MVLGELAATSRNDPGCVAYSFNVDIEDMNTFRSVEMWASQEEMEAHMQTPHVGAAIAAAPDLLAAELKIDNYTVAS